MSNCPAPCPSCPRRYRPLPGDGPRPARFLAISDFPGETEERTGRVQTGKGGEELEHTYLPLAGLRRSDIRLTNVQQCFPGHGKSGDKRAAQTCAPHHIPEEIRETKPEVILLMGGMATKLCKSINIEAMHGIPQHTSKVGDVFGWQGWVVPMYNPALGLREGRWMTYLLEDWENLERELDAPGDPPAPEVNYRVLRAGAETAYMQSRYCPYPLGVDTEDHGGVPYSVQFSHCPGEGWFIYANDRETIGWFRQWVRGREQTLHNADHDKEVERRMGIPVNTIRDTQQEAFQLGNLPQGLKPLVYRLFRQTMTSWEDTVRPASITALVSWLSDALLVARADLYSTKTKEFKTCECGHSLLAHAGDKHDQKCSCRVYTPRQEIVEVRGSAEALFDRLLKHTDVASEYDPWERLADWRAESESEYMHIVARCGEYPILGIGNCSEAQAVQYAVGDADWTGRAAVELERRRDDSRFRIAPGDEDA